MNLLEHVDKLVLDGRASAHVVKGVYVFGPTCILYDFDAMVLLAHFNFQAGRLASVFLGELRAGKSKVGQKYVFAFDHFKVTLKYIRRGSWSGNPADYILYVKIAFDPNTRSAFTAEYMPMKLTAVYSAECSADSFPAELADEASVHIKLVHPPTLKTIAGGRSNGFHRMLCSAKHDLAPAAHMLRQTNPNLYDPRVNALINAYL